MEYRFSVPLAFFVGLFGLMSYLSFHGLRRWYFRLISVHFVAAAIALGAVQAGSVALLERVWGGGFWPLFWPYFLALLLGAGRFYQLVRPPSWKFLVLNVGFVVLSYPVWVLGGVIAVCEVHGSCEL